MSYYHTDLAYSSGPQKNKNKKHYTRAFFGFLVFVSILFLFGRQYVLKNIVGPVELSMEESIVIPSGYSVIKTAYFLEERGFVQSALAFRFLAQMQEVSIKAGSYNFKPGVYELEQVLNRIVSADYGDIYESITIPEGYTVAEIGELLAGTISDFNQKDFDELTLDKEGYLFPDTYFVSEQTTLVEMIETLSDTFSQKISGIQEVIDQSGRSLEDIVIMASIIEREAGNDPVEQAMVSGILWKRIDEGMLLQVDAPFVYAIGKGSAELRLSDLRLDGPYNTYTRTGLTPTPIGNPGLSALRAAANPTDSEYYFYLHDSEGGIHYGVTHSDHVNNKNRYLR